LTGAASTHGRSLMVRAEHGGRLAETGRRSAPLPTRPGRRGRQALASPAHLSRSPPVRRALHPKSHSGPAEGPLAPLPVPLRRKTAVRKYLRRTALVAALVLGCGLTGVIPAQRVRTQATPGKPDKDLDGRLAAVLQAAGFTGRIEGQLTQRLGRPLNPRLANVAGLVGDGVTRRCPPGMRSPSALSAPAFPCSGSGPRLQTRHLQDLPSHEREAHGVPSRSENGVCDPRPA
jgi:hypothetical protein